MHYIDTMIKGLETKETILTYYFKKYLLKSQTNEEGEERKGKEKEGDGGDGRQAEEKKLVKKKPIEDLEYYDILQY